MFRDEIRVVLGEGSTLGSARCLRFPPLRLLVLAMADNLTVSAESLDSFALDEACPQPSSDTWKITGARVRCTLARLTMLSTTHILMLGKAEP